MDDGNVNVAKERHTTTFKVNGRSIVTRAKVLTVRQILQLAELDADSHYLVEQRGDGTEIEHRDLHEGIHIHEHQEFLAFYTGPTPVS